MMETVAPGLLVLRLAENVEHRCLGELVVLHGVVRLLELNEGLADSGAFDLEIWAAGESQG